MQWIIFLIAGVSVLALLVLRAFKRLAIQCLPMPIQSEWDENFLDPAFRAGGLSGPEAEGAAMRASENTLTPLSSKMGRGSTTAQLRDAP